MEQQQLSTAVQPAAPASPVSTSEAPRQRMKRGWKIALALLAGMIVVGSAAVILLLSTSSTFNVEGDTMLPTLYSEQRVLVSRLLPALRGFLRGDIVVFHAPSEPRYFVKRVTAVAGDEVRISADSDPEGDPGRVGDECGGCGVYVNGVLLHEKYVLSTPDYDYGPFTVPSGHIFLLGDNRRNSNDSHVWNALDVSEVTGKVIYSIWPNQGNLPDADFPEVGSGKD